MIFKIAHFELNTDTRELLDGERKQSIRPKTLALLLYLMERKGTLVSKSQLLQEVWDDVSVHEGVIFQSIREIRTLFADLNVVQNHPRKGYQWLVPIQRVESQELAGHELKKSAFTFTKRTYAAVVSIALISVITLVWFSKQITPQPILQVSVQNRIDRNDLDGLRQTKVDALVMKLEQSLPDFEVKMGVSDSLAFHSEPRQLDWILDIKLYGDIYDFKVVYSLKRKELEFSDAIVSYSLVTALNELHEHVTKSIIDNKVDEHHPGADFATMVIAYETDWEMALPQLKEFVSDYPDNIEAKLMLCRLMLWQSQHEAALQLSRQALSNLKLTSAQEARFYLLKAQALYPNSAQSALEVIKQGLTVAVDKASWLARAELEELQGDILREQDSDVVALRSYLKAQSIYDEINLPVNATGLKLKLSGLHLDMGDTLMAKRFYQQARQEIQSREMTFLYGQLEEYSRYFEQHSR